MATAFASHEWTEALGEELRGDGKVRTDSMTWVFGPVGFLVEADSEHGVEHTLIRLDLHEGEIRGVELIDPAGAARIPTVISGTLARWKAIFRGEISLVPSIVDAKLSFSGDLPTMTRHSGLFDALAAAGSRVDTAWQDKQEAPATASARA